jgi:hypothetical protein
MARRKSTSAADANLLLPRDSADWQRIAEFFITKYCGQKRAVPRKTKRDDIIVCLHRDHGRSFGQIELLSQKPLWRETLAKPIKAKTAEKACNRRLKQLAAVQLAPAK